MKLEAKTLTSVWEQTTNDGEAIKHFTPSSPFNQIVALQVQLQERDAHRAAESSWNSRLQQYFDDQISLQTFLMWCAAHVTLISATHHVALAAMQAGHITEASFRATLKPWYRQIPSNPERAEAIANERLQELSYEVAQRSRVPTPARQDVLEASLERQERQLIMDALHQQGAG